MKYLAAPYEDGEGKRHSPSREFLGIDSHFRYGMSDGIGNGFFGASYRKFLYSSSLMIRWQ